MKTRFKALQDQIGCTGVWLANQLDMSPEHLSRIRNGHSPMPRSVELAMMAFASGWRP